MASPTGKQIITIHILPGISRSNDNQILKFGQLIEYNVRYIFLQTHTESAAGRLVPDLFLFLKKRSSP